MYLSLPHHPAQGYLIKTIINTKSQKNHLNYCSFHQRFLPQTSANREFRLNWRIDLIHEDSIFTSLILCHYFKEKMLNNSVFSVSSFKPFLFKAGKCTHSTIVVILFCDWPLQMDLSNRCLFTFWCIGNKHIFVNLIIIETYSVTDEYHCNTLLTKSLCKTFIITSSLHHHYYIKSSMFFFKWRQINKDDRHAV